MTKILTNFTHQDTVATITLNNPRGNVLDRAMMDELLQALHAFKDNRILKLIIFEGAGEHFSYGASVEEHQKEQVAGMLKNFHQVFYELIDLSIPTLAKISGFCLGGGLELALMCNFLFAEPGARLGQPEIVLGVFPPPASVLLPMKIGYARAEELLLTGKTISAQEARNLGLLNNVFSDPEALIAGVENFIEQHILPKSASSLRFAVKAARIAFNETVMTRLAQLEKFYIQELMETHDANEGIAAFIEKRTPQWTNS